MGLCFKFRSEGGPKVSLRGTRRCFPSAAKWSALAREQTFCSASKLSLASQRFQPRHPQQVIGACDKVSPGLSSFTSAVTSAPQSTHRFDPTEDFFHPLSYPQAGLVSRLGRGPGIQSLNLHPLLTRCMRRDLPLAAAL